MKEDEFDDDQTEPVPGVLPPQEWGKFCAEHLEFQKRLIGSLRGYASKGSDIQSGQVSRLYPDICKLEDLVRDGKVRGASVWKYVSAMSRYGGSANRKWMVRLPSVVNYPAFRCGPYETEEEAARVVFQEILRRKGIT